MRKVSVIVQAIKYFVDLIFVGKVALIKVIVQAIKYFVE